MRTKAWEDALAFQSGWKRLGTSPRIARAGTEEASTADSVSRKSILLYYTSKQNCASVVNKTAAYCSRKTDRRDPLGCCAGFLGSDGDRHFLCSASGQSRILPFHDGHQTTRLDVANPGAWYYGITVKTISFKVSPEEEREIKSRAHQQRLTVSQFLRQQATAPLRPVPALELRLCPLTGAMVFASAESLPPLNVETTRQMLADFP